MTKKGFCDKVQKLSMENTKHQKKELVKYANLLGKEELVAGPSGNISLRLGSKIIIKASGVWLEEARVSDFVELDLNKLNCKPEPLKPSCEWGMHLACYNARQDITCVMHTHPFYATFLASCSLRPKIFLPECIAYIGSRLAILPYYCPGTEELAKRHAFLIKKHNIIYLKNHGLLAVGSSLKEAFLRTMIIEKMAKMQIIAKVLGRNLKVMGEAEINKILGQIKK